MNNAMQQPQTILVLGGGSDIAQAIVHATRLAGVDDGGPRRPADTPIELSTPLGEAVSVVSVEFDALDHAGHDALVRSVADAHGDLDVVIQAFGQLGDDSANDDPVAAAALAEVNYVGAVSSGLAVAGQLRAPGPRHARRAVERRRRADAGVELRLRVDQGRPRMRSPPGSGMRCTASGAKVMVVRPASCARR